MDMILIKTMDQTRCNSYGLMKRFAYIDHTVFNPYTISYSDSR